MPGELILFVSRLLARHRKETGTRKNTRSLSFCRQALFVLAWYRDKADIPRLGWRRPLRTGGCGKSGWASCAGRA